MAIKDIFTIVDIYDDRMPAARVALELGAKTGAHVTGLAIAMEPLAPGFLASPIPADYIVGALEEAERQAKDACRRFSAIASGYGCGTEARSSTVLAGATGPVVGQAHLSDLVVIGQENVDQPEPMRAALIEAMMFDAGVPLMLIPFGHAGGFKADRALIAWDGSSTAARAVHAALPVLALARSIEVTIVATSKAWVGEPGADVARYLSRHGMDVTVNTVNKDAGDVAQTLMRRADATSADLMVMGAYGHSRLREFIIGGATRTMLEEMRVPTIMAH